MATRSKIAALNQNGTVTAIYCHWDGYPSHTGKVLLEHYSTEPLVRDLLATGSLSHIDSEGNRFNLEDADGFEYPSLQDFHADLTSMGVEFAYMFDYTYNRWSFISLIDRNPIWKILLPAHCEK